MLRFAVIALVLANVGYYLWSDGALASIGLAPAQQAESHRVQQQIAPELLQVMPLKDAPDRPPPPGEGHSENHTDLTPPPATGADLLATSPATPASAPPSETATAATTRNTASASTDTVAQPDADICYTAGIFDERQVATIRTAAAQLPAGSWQLENTHLPGRWMVYMGRFADQEALEKKQGELRSRKVAFDRANNPDLEPGLSLGRFTSQESAERELANLSKQGVRTARVVQERPETPGYILRLPRVTDAMKPLLGGLRAALGGKTLRPCNAVS